MVAITASMAGNVWKVLVSEGDIVKQDQEIFILESMKMEIPIISETAGTVKRVFVQEGNFVNEGDPLAEIE